MTFVFWNPYQKNRKRCQSGGVCGNTLHCKSMRVLSNTWKDETGSNPVLTTQKTMDRVSLPHQEMGFRSPNSQVAELVKHCKV